MAVQMLYQQDLGGGDLREVFARFRPTEYSGSQPSEAPVVEEAFLRAQGLVEGTLAHLAEIDALIRDQADNWRLERMPAVDRNILRLAVFEFQHQHVTLRFISRRPNRFREFLERRRKAFAPVHGSPGVGFNIHRTEALPK